MLKMIKIPEDVCTDIERKMYEYNVARDNIAFLISSNRTDVALLESAIFKEYVAEELRRYKIYEEAKNEMVKKYVPEEDKSASWNLNFKTQNLEIEQKDE